VTRVLIARRLLLYPNIRMPSPRVALTAVAVALFALACPPHALAQAPLAPPVAGVSVNLAPVKGTVLVQCPGEPAFAPLTAPRQIPLGCDVDTSDGTVSLTTARRDGTTQTGSFWDGLFTISQDGDVGVLTLSGKLACGGHRDATAAKKRKRRGRRMWGTGKGRFRTTGRRGSASTRGTTWLTEDSCESTTAVSVREGVVDVRDFVRRKTVAVKAGQTYVAGSYRSCGNLQFTPNSGDALVRISAAGLSCGSARGALRKWRKNRYRPSTGPSGWKCTGTGFPTRYQCTRGTQGMRFQGGT
jgi:hypothetical protein